VMPERPDDLSGCSFLISCLSSSGVNGVMNRGCVVVVSVEACSFILGRSLATSCALFSS